MERKSVLTNIHRSHSISSSTDRKIAALEAKLLALRKGKEVAADESSSSNPTASTSTLTGEVGEGERWLDSLGGNVKVGAVEGVGSSSTTVENDSQEEARIKKRAENLAKAGLPTKPWFESIPRPT